MGACIPWPQHRTTTDIIISQTFEGRARSHHGIPGGTSAHKFVFFAPPTPKKSVPLHMVTFFPPFSNFEQFFYDMSSDVSTCSYTNLFFSIPRKIPLSLPQIWLATCLRRATFGSNSVTFGNSCVLYKFCTALACYVISV